MNVIIYGSVVLAVLTAFIGVGFIHAEKFSLASIGLILIISGLAIRWTAILSLRRYFTVEEQVLIQAFGNEYEDYCRSTWRLMPWLY